MFLVVYDDDDDHCTRQYSNGAHLSSQVRLIDAGFLWTEPHSKRIKIKLTIQKEVWNQGKNIHGPNKTQLVIWDGQYAFRIFIVFLNLKNIHKRCIHCKVALRLFYEQNKRSVCSWLSHVCLRVVSLTIGCHCIFLTFSENLSLVRLLFVQLESLYSSAQSSYWSVDNSSIKNPNVSFPNSSVNEFPAQIFAIIFHAAGAYGVSCCCLLQVMNGAILQQVFVVEFVIQSQMCDDCHRVEAKDFWKAVVQVRQKVDTRGLYAPSVKVIFTFLGVDLLF